MWKEPYYDKLQVSQASRRLFQYSRKTLCRFQLREVGSHVSVRMTYSKSPDAHQSATYVWTRWRNRPDAHQCLETLNYSRLHPSGRNGKSSGQYLEFVKILVFQYIRLEDVIFLLDSQLFKHHPSGQRELYIRTFLYVKKLRTDPTYIRPNVSGARPDVVQCLISYGIYFQNTDMGRQLQQPGRCGFPSGRSHL
jgi:hypothetical protein